MHASLGKVREAGIGQIMRRTVKLHAQFRCSVIYDSHWSLWRELPDKYLVPIRRIETTYYKGKVFNIETTDNTYLISNVVSHNCGTVIPWIPPVTVKRDKWSRNLPAEVLLNIREHG